MLRVGNVTLGKRPRVVVAMRDDQDRAAMEAALADGADIIELRVDSFSNTEPGYCATFFDRLSGLPLLLTIRAEHEGGDWTDTDAKRLELFNMLIPRSNAVDIELSSSAIRDQVIGKAREHNCVVIGSFHNFTETPADAELERIVNMGARAGVDIVKIAAKTHNNNDLHRLARVCLQSEYQPIVVIGMGPRSMLSRVFFPALGSLLTYTFLGKPTAPGQMNLADLASAIRTYYPSTL